MRLSVGNSICFAEHQARAADHLARVALAATAAVALSDAAAVAAVVVSPAAPAATVVTALRYSSASEVIERC
jgi:hypothetical protein